MDPFKGELKKKHHFYVGILALLLVFVLIWKTATALWVLVALTLFGLWMVIDDLYQHWIQTRKDPTYRSPVNRLYRKLFGKLHVKIAEWIEDKLGLPH